MCLRKRKHGTQQRYVDLLRTIDAREDIPQRNGAQRVLMASLPYSRIPGGEIEDIRRILPGPIGDLWPWAKPIRRHIRTLSRETSRLRGGIVHAVSSQRLLARSSLDARHKTR